MRTPGLIFSAFFCVDTLLRCITPNLYGQTTTAHGDLHSRAVNFLTHRRLDHQIKSPSNWYKILMVLDLKRLAMKHAAEAYSYFMLKVVHACFSFRLQIHERGGIYHLTRGIRDECKHVRLRVTLYFCCSASPSSPKRSRKT